jgi:GNAT superfamily N-acetyltransferase
MSKHKLIMESWRKFLTESDRGYRTTTPDGNDVYLLHEKTGPTDQNNRLTLYTIDPSAFDSLLGGGSLNIEEIENGHQDIGSVFVMETRKPCIPNTYQVGAIHTAPEFDRQGYGTLLYDLAFLVAADRGYGLTSDRGSGTKTTARGIWASIEANDAKYEKRKTRVVDLEDPAFTPEQNDMLRDIIGAPEDVKKVGGNDRFDYNQRTLDPDDDCGQSYGGKDNATDHSFILRDTSAIKAVYDQLTGNHKALMELLNEQDPSTEDELDDGNTLGRIAQGINSMIVSRTSDNFGDRYTDADE